MQSRCALHLREAPAPRTVVDVAAQEDGEQKALDSVDRRRLLQMRINLRRRFLEALQLGVCDIPVRIEPDRIRFARLGWPGDLPLGEPLRDDVGLRLVPGPDPFPGYRVAVAEGVEQEGHGWLGGVYAAPRYLIL